jgi:gamma-glutamylcyclotransferase
MTFAINLQDHRLDFYFNNTRWQGAAATIVPEKNREVWGAVWEIDLSNMEHLDKQEGVHKQVYRPLSVPIHTPDGEILLCRAYQLVKNPENLPEGAEVPIDRQPSRTYLEIIQEGAMESGLPECYIEFLKKVKHNGNVVESDTTRAIEEAKKRRNPPQA